MNYKTTDAIFELIDKELKRQNEVIELIASENFVSDNILKAMGSCLTNKYAEGYPYLRTTGRKGRYYGGTYVIDEIEETCCTLFKDLYNTNYHVNVQPHSGSSANMAAYFSILEKGDTILSMSLDAGGHLSHGSKVSFSGKLFNIVNYGLDNNGYLDYENIMEIAKKCKPKAIIAGASTYSRKISYKKFREVADAVGAYLIVDMAHIAGLVAVGAHESPFGLADIITSTTHKTLRGPRGGIVFCKPELANKIDSAVFPCIQGGPLEHIIAAKAICAIEAMQPSFKKYIYNVIENANAMANEFISLGYNVVSGGTDNHMFLLDLSSTNISGRRAQEKLDEHGITLNKNAVPNDTRSPKETSGVRIGTAAMTTKGFTKEDFIKTARKIDTIIKEKE